MPYTPPEYQEFLINTDNLLTLFNNLSQRYIPDKYEDLRKKVAFLEEKYNDKSQQKSGILVSTNAELRRDQTACITQLLPKLPLEGSTQVIKQA